MKVSKSPETNEKIIFPRKKNFFFWFSKKKRICKKKRKRIRFLRQILHFEIFECEKLFRNNILHIENLCVKSCFETTFYTLKNLSVKSCFETTFYTFSSRVKFWAKVVCFPPPPELSALLGSLMSSEKWKRGSVRVIKCSQIHHGTRLVARGHENHQK